MMDDMHDCIKLFIADLEKACGDDIRAVAMALLQSMSDEENGYLLTTDSHKKAILAALRARGIVHHTEVVLEDLRLRFNHDITPLLRSELTKLVQ